MSSPVAAGPWARAAARVVARTVACAVSGALLALLISASGFGYRASAQSRQAIATQTLGVETVATPALATSQSVQTDLWGTVALSLHHQRVGGAQGATTGALEGRLETRAAWGRWWASLALEPRARVDFTAGGGGGSGGGSGGGAGSTPAVDGSVSVTEALVAYRAGAVDLYAGRVTLPVETARLTVPYTLTPPDERGRRIGLEGVRADLYVGSNRLQLAAVRLSGRWTPVAALRHASAGWEVSGRLLVEEDGLAAGVGWSGLIGEVVAYGEIWRVPGEADPRYSAGASGYVGDGLWTAELARAPLLPMTGPPVPHAALEVAYAPLPGFRVVAGAAASLGGVGGGGPATIEEEPARRWGIAATYELEPGVSEIELSVQRLATPWIPATLSAGAGVRYYF